MCTQRKRPPLCGRSDCDCKLCLVRPTRGRSPNTSAYPSVVRGFALRPTATMRRTSCGGPFARHHTCSKCRDARSVRPLCQRLRYQSVSTISGCFNGNGRPPTQHYPCVPTTVTRLALTETDAQIVRPYNSYSSRCSGTDALPLDTPVRPYSGYTSRFNGNGRSTERPYNRYTSRCSGTKVLPLDTPARPYKGLLVSLEEFKLHRGISQLLAGK